MSGLLELALFCPIAQAMEKPLTDHDLFHTDSPLAARSPSTSSPPAGTRHTACNTSRTRPRRREAFPTRRSTSSATRRSRAATTTRSTRTPVRSGTRLRGPRTRWRSSGSSSSWSKRVCDHLVLCCAVLCHKGGYCRASRPSSSGLWREIGLLRYQADNHAIVYMPFGNHTHYVYIVHAKFRKLHDFLVNKMLPSSTKSRENSDLPCLLTFVFAFLCRKSMLFADLRVHSMSFYCRSFKLIYKSGLNPFPATGALTGF